MKKAKLVEVPLDRSLTLIEYAKLSKQAMNSAKWHAEKYQRNSHMIKFKLRSKGFPDHDITYIDKEKQEQTANFIEDTIKQLCKTGALDNDKFADDYVNSSVNSGYSMIKIKNKMRERRYSNDEIDDAIERYKQDNGDPAEELFERDAEKLSRRSSFTKLEPFKRKQKFISALATKGHSLNLIYDWLENNSEEMESWEE